MIYNHPASNVNYLARMPHWTHAPVTTKHHKPLLSPWCWCTTRHRTPILVPWCPLTNNYYPSYSALFSDSHELITVLDSRTPDYIHGKRLVDNSPAILLLRIWFAPHQSWFSPWYVSIFNKSIYDHPASNVNYMTRIPYCPQADLLDITKHYMPVLIPWCPPATTNILALSTLFSNSPKLNNSCLTDTGPYTRKADGGSFFWDMFFLGFRLHLISLGWVSDTWNLSSPAWQVTKRSIWTVT